MEHLEHGERARDFFLQPWSPPPPPPLPPPLPSRARIGGSGTRAVGDPARGDAARPIDQSPGVTAADRPAGAGPPAEHGRRKHSAGGLESVLSGSEEDIHLETVNAFFERHGRPAGPEEPPEPGPERLQARGDVTLETEPRRGGPWAGDGDSPETVAALHCPTAGSEAALGTDATQTAGGNVDINTMNKAGADLDTTPEGADGSSRVETNKLTNPETESLNKEDRPMTTATHELRQCSGDRGPSDDFICLENTLGSGRALTSERCKRWRDAEYGQPSLNMETLCRIVGAVVEEKLQQVNINLLLPGLDPDSPKRSAGKDRPQSDYSSRRKKKRKKRCSSLLEKSEHRGQFSAEPKEWQHAQRSGVDPRLVKNRGEVRVSDVHGPDCTDVTQTSSFIENPSDYIHPQHPPVPDNADRLASSAASHSGGQRDALHPPPADTGKSIAAHWQADDSRAPAAAAADGGNVAARSRAHRPPRQNESTGSSLTRRSMTPASACERRFLSGDEEAADHVRALHEKRHSPASRSCQSGGKSHFHAAEVSATVGGAARGGDSSDPMREANQNDKGANTEQSELAAETGFPGRDNPTECPRPPQHSQKLEIDCHKAVQLGSAYLAGAPIVVIGSDTKGLTQESQIELNNCSGVINNPADGHFDLDFSEVSLDAESTAPNSQHVTMPELTVFSGETSPEGIQPPEPHITTVQLTDTSSFQSEEISSTSSISLDGLPNNNESISTNTPKLTQSYGDLCNAEPPKHEGNIVEKSDHAPQIVDTDKRVKAIKEIERQEASQGPSELQCQLEGPDPTSETGDAVSIAPDSKNKVFAMSSFWNEMERLTIKDILGLRTSSVTTPPRSLSPLVETEEADNTDTDSGYFTPRLDDTKAVSAIPASEPAKVNSAAGIHDDASFRSLDVMWDGEPSPVSLGGGIYPENMTSDTDNPQPPLTTSSEERCRRQMLKNTSVHNLRAMDSELFRQTRKVQTLAAVIPEESESERERFPDAQKPCCDSGGDSMSSSLLTEGTPADSYRISLTGIFQCLFGGKQSDPKPPDSGDAGTYCISGNTVPETYDQFFSEFDCGSFFYPLTAAEDRPKDQLVPIFSRSRSVSRYLQYPEAYDHFLSSSSSSDDDSSTESEVDDSGEVLGPIRVVTRSSRGTAEAPASTDIYENFFTDLDLRQNFFWKPTFSLRNVSLIGPASQRQRRCGLLAPADPGSLQRRCRAFPSLNALDSQGPLDPGPGLYHYEERIYRNLQPFSFEDLQSAVSQQSLGASLVPLRQSDMCLVCIAFASWVLKSADPHVGDAWKAVLLANVSALSAIGYLRKYMRDRSVDQPAASRPML